MTKRRSFKRPLGKSRYKKMFVIAAEGSKTEPLYFKMLDTVDSVVHFKCLKNRDRSAPSYVLKKMMQYIKTKGLRKNDEAWLVVDKDTWGNEQLKELHDWSKKKDNYNFALSNPKFEYWLLLHFEDGDGISNPILCSQRLKKYLPKYDKNIEESKLKPNIEAAILRAKIKDTPRCPDWPKQNGSTVYRIVEKIYSAK